MHALKVLTNNILWENITTPTEYNTSELGVRNKSVYKQLKQRVPVAIEV